VKSPTFACALAMLSALALAGPTTAAGADRIEVEIKTFPNGQARYSGDIDSDKSGCESGRTVKIYAKKARVVKTRTDSEGEFSATGRAAEEGDKLTVKVPRDGDCQKLVGTGEAE
jgi:hypothetical protein